MPFSKNVQTIVGTIGGDAETRETPSGVKVVTLSIATDYDYVDKNGQKQVNTTWHRVVGYNISEYFIALMKRGNRIHVEGRAENRTYEKDGQTKFIHETIISNSGIIPIDGIPKKSVQAQEPKAEVVNTQQETQDNLVTEGQLLPADEDLPI